MRLDNNTTTDAYVTCTEEIQVFFLGDCHVQTLHLNQGITLKRMC